MPKDFIPVATNVTTATQAQLLLRYRDSLRASYDLISQNEQLNASYQLGLRLLAVMDHLNDGSDYTDLEMLFGLPKDQGKTTYDLVSASVQSLATLMEIFTGKSLAGQLSKELTERIG